MTTARKLFLRTVFCLDIAFLISLRSEPGNGVDVSKGAEELDYLRPPLALFDQVKSVFIQRRDLPCLRQR